MRKQSANTEEQYNPVDLGDILQDLEKKVKIQSITIGEENRISTGLLCLDIVLGGGLTAGMYTTAGPEQSAKTTLVVSMMAASVKQNVNARVLWDAENSSGSSMDYVENVFNTQGVDVDLETLFGVKDKSGKYTTKPLVYYRDEGEMDTFYNWFSGFLRRLPDKRFEGERWWYVYPADQEHKAKYKGQYDRRMSSAQGALYIPAPDGSLQAIVMIDSYPALLPASLDDDDPRSGMALQAREFSRHIPRVKGKLRAKRVCLLGINQLREAPAVMFKDPNYEPGGQALRFNCMAPDTYVLTDRGMLTAEELSLSYKKGEKICGRLGREASNGFEAKGYSTILELRTCNGLYLRGKPGHSILTLQGGNLTPEFKTIGELQSLAAGPGKFYAALRLGSEVFSKKDPKLDFEQFVLNEGSKKSVRIPKTMNTDLAYMAGALVGDGYVRNGGAGLVNRDKHVIEKFVKICRKEFEVKVSTASKKKNCLTAGFNSREIGQFLAYIGVGNKSSHTKEVPWVIRQGTREIQAAFLAGHMDTDKLMTSSKKMHEQLVTMLLNFGVLPGARPREKENFFKHGELFSFERPTREFNKNALKAGVFVITVYGEMFERLDDCIGKYRANSDKTSQRADNKRRKAIWKEKFVNRGGVEGFVLPTGEAAWRKDCAKLLELQNMVRTLYPKDNRSGRLFYDGRADLAIERMQGLVSSLRTSQERMKASNAIQKYQDFVNMCKDEKLVFVEIDQVTGFNERMMTYDGNMPATSTIVTNGIVSHNSDVRMRVTPRALSGVPFNPKGKGQIETEASLADGEDTYRYVHLKAIKNKLSVPNRETWLRIWVQDSDSKARGFDPVWDTFYALSMTGQVSGKRTSMMLELHGLGKAKRSIDWTQFKQLVLGSKEEIVAVCTRLGYKPFNLRRGLFNLVRKGVMEKLYAETHKAKVSKVKAKNEDDVEDEDDED